MGPGPTAYKISAIGGARDASGENHGCSRNSRPFEASPSRGEQTADALPVVDTTDRLGEERRDRDDLDLW